MNSNNNYSSRVTINLHESTCMMHVESDHVVSRSFGSSFRSPSH